MRSVWSVCCSVGLTVVMIGSSAYAKWPEERGPKPDKCEIGEIGSVEGTLKAGCPKGPDDSRGPGGSDRPDPRPSPKPKPSPRPKTCDPAAVAAVRDAIAVMCPCEGTTDGSGAVVAWRNHGEYVSCVARAKGAARRSSTVAPRCLRDTGDCAARSTCGKRAQAVVCSFPGVSCVDGLCADGSGTACATDDACGNGICTVGSSAARCEDAGGVPGLGSCCDPAPLGSPSGAFLDGAMSF